MADLMALVRCTFLVYALQCSGSFASYDPYYEPTKYQLVSYPVYDKHEPKNTYSQPQYSSYDPYSSYGYSKNEAGNDGYGYQTRTTFVDNNKYHIPKPQYSPYTPTVGSGSSSGVYDLARRSYYKQSQPIEAYQNVHYVYQPKPNYTPRRPSYGYSSKPVTYKTINKPNSYNVHDYPQDSYDPCHSMQEGDYSLQGEFASVFPGIDSQCNFVKCANYKAYVNPCSIGTKNDEYGGPHPKKGFCAGIDYQHYCGHIPPSPPEAYEYDIYK